MKVGELLQFLNREFHAEIPRSFVHQAVTRGDLTPDRDKNNNLIFDQGDIEKIKAMLASQTVSRYQQEITNL